PLLSIKNQIAFGNTYEVNYTYDYSVFSPLNGLDLYNQILSNQKTPYNAYIKNQYEEVLCFSPELFFTLKGNKITTKPMKGTVKRGATSKEDASNIKFLQNDIKNRAENVMIVDLLRNDLGKIAKTGSVNVDKLFEIETHKTLHTMTSTISAEIHDDATLYDVFEAIFPCGSITGAPKISTMKIIDQEESGRRNIYCGAIGLITPDECVFNVPIRILQKQNGQNHYKYRVGGAIVWDSSVFDEGDETLVKMKFLDPSDSFKLVETLLAQDGEFVFGDEHFFRMQKSACELGFKFNEELLSLKPQKNGMVRVLLSRNGEYEVQNLALAESKTDKIEIADTFVDSTQKLLYHKTTYRPWYEEAMAKIKSGEVYDVIFVNEKGELTEGARTNIVLEIDGEMYTPPISCGLLNGVFRQQMIDNGDLKEKILYPSDLTRAQNIFCINSLRGKRRVRL
ncbi:MAG: bifunctional anthranilate synthase component I family protein/class IV aminotransferase, partial [Candidatus Gastranaerophilales bacterium]|nr:bifunctional anthranilate synthase component I family protein/class IV aminotransferase [Candidatus Gastranaerophilales bacterium]